MSDKYEYKFMSFHGVQDEMFLEINQDKEIISGLPEWLETLPHESLWYLDEMEQRLGITLKGGVQFVPEGEHYEGLPSRYVVISNGFLENGFKGYVNKGWNKWKELIPILKGYYECDVVAIGGEDKTSWGEDLDVFNLTGKTNILETIMIIANAMALVSTDTGVAHIADAICKPGVVLFGPTLVSKNGPINGTMIPVRVTMECSPCQGTLKFSECDGGCMEKLTVPMVMKELRRVT
jgi:ADP-heptose:LPS heptosyltransferase